VAAGRPAGGVVRPPCYFLLLERICLMTRLMRSLSRYFFLRPTSNAGSSFPRSNTLNLSFSCGGLTDVKFDGQGRLFWSDEALSLGSASGIYVDQVDPVAGAVLASNRATTGSGDDKSIMAIDTSPGSPFFNNIYLVWARFSVNTDGGLTWATPFQVNDDPHFFDPGVGGAIGFGGPPLTTYSLLYFC